MAWATMMASNVDQTLVAAAGRAVEEPTAMTEPQEMCRKVEEPFNFSGRVGCKRAQVQVNARTSHTSQPTQIQTPLAAQVILPSQSDIPPLLK